MTAREELIRSPFTKAMRLIEIGASYRPIVPKSEGWQTTVVDHASREEIAAKYRNHDVAIDRIEQVDVIWRDGTIADAFLMEEHGQFDGLIASHVGEHFPDLIGFLQASDRLLARDGIIALALPDKRITFDFFRPLSMTGDLLATHSERRTRHSARTRYNWMAYFASSGGQPGWARNSRPNLHFENTLDDAWRAYNDTNERTEAPYEDAHAWVFTPASFELVILELNQLGIIPWFPISIEPASGVEFYAWLSRSNPRFEPRWLQERRLYLLKATIFEVEQQIAQLRAEEPKASTVASAAQPPNVAAIIPLYNGASHIEAALRSVLAQILAPSEIIVVNDGSTDGGPEIVERIARQHPIRLLHKPNGGQSSARNFGVAHSSAQTIAFLDQDDIWYPEHLKELVRPFTDCADVELGWAYSDLDEVDEKGRIVCRNFLSTLPATHPKKELTACLGGDMFVLPSASLISRKAFDQVGGFDERLSGYEDDDLFLRLFRAGYQNVYLDKAYSQWRIYVTSSSYTFRMARSRMIYARKLFEEYPDEPERYRFYTRDYLAPRFYTQALQEFKAALLTNDIGNIRQAWEDVRYVVGFLNTRQSTRVRLTVSLLKSPRLARLIFAGRRKLRPVMLRAFHPA